MEASPDKKLLSRLEKALELLENAEIEDGLNLLKMCEERIGLAEDIDADLKLITYHNIAMCYQLMQEFEECGSYLEKTISIAESREFSQDIEKIRNIRYLCMLNIQLGAILSHLGDHNLAVSQAKRAFNYASQSYQMCVSLSEANKSLNDTAFQNYKTLETALLYLSGKISKFPTNCRKIVQRTSLGVLHYTDWVFSFTINDILDIKPLKYFEVKNNHTFLAELSKDFMLEKVCLMLSSCYLIATETRLLDDPNEVKKAKGWHQKAVEIGLVLLPQETPLLQHIKSSFDKHYPAKPQPRILKVAKSKTPIKDSRCTSAKSKTPIRPKLGMPRKVIKNIEVKTDRSFIKEKPEPRKKDQPDLTPKCKTQREDNQEPEPPISEDYDEPENNTFVINSNDLYGIYSDEDKAI